MEQIEPNVLEVFDILIMEPMRSITDVMVGVISLICWYRLYRNQVDNISFTPFLLYFFFMGLATISAGTIGHAFQYIFEYNWKTLGWSFSALSIFMLQKASYQNQRSVIGEKVYSILSMAAFIQIATFFVLIINPGTRLFVIVQTNTAIGLIGTILPVHVYAVYKQNIQSSKWISLALFWGLTPAFVYNFELGLHQWFDHSAVAHMLIIIFLIIMYQGVRRVTPQSKKIYS